MKENSKMIPRNKKSVNLTLISWKNQRLNREVFFENVNREITENKDEIKLNYDSKTKLNAKRR